MQKKNNYNEKKWIATVEQIYFILFCAFQLKTLNVKKKTYYSTNSERELLYCVTTFTPLHPKCLMWNFSFYSKFNQDFSYCNM